LGLAQFYSTGPNPPGQPAHWPFSPTRAPGRRSDRAAVGSDRASYSCAPCHLPSRPPRVGHAAPPRVPVSAVLIPCLVFGEATIAQIANTIAILRALALPPTSFLCSPLPGTVDVKHPDVPPAARAAARAFAYTSQAEEHPPQSATTSSCLLLPPSGTPSWAGRSGPPPASSPPPQATPQPGAPRRPHKLRPQPLQRPLTSEPPPPTAPPWGALLR
jgi:hypothetical protein